jgi:hypothetical protein
MAPEPCPIPGDRRRTNNEDLWKDLVSHAGTEPTGPDPRLCAPYTGMGSWTQMGPRGVEPRTSPWWDDHHPVISRTL